MVEGDGIRQVHIGWLKPHLFSVEVYGPEAADKDLVESITAVGIQTPLQVTVDGVVISGHRRLEAAKQTHLKTVPVYVVRPRSLPGAVEEQILEANRSRVKDNEQKVREFTAYKVIETARAKERNGYRWDLVPNSARGDAEPKPGVDPRPITTLVREVGKARNLAAAKLGMSGSTAADGEKVVAALDRLWAEEKYEDHRQLRDALFKSIHGALKLGLEKEWIPKPVQKPERKDRAATSTVSAGHPGDEPDHDLENTDETSDTAHELINVADAAPDTASAEIKTPTPPTGSTPDRDRQSATDVVMAESPQAVPLSSDEDTSALQPSGVAPSSPAIPAIVSSPAANPGEGSPTLAGEIAPSLSPIALGRGLTGEPEAAGTLAATAAIEPVVNTNSFAETGENFAAEHLVPTDKIEQIVEAVTTRSVDSANYELVPLIRYLVPEIAAVINRAKQRFPEESGHQLSRANSFANGKIQVAMGWL